MLINLQKGAYKELLNEMNIQGIELRIHNTLKPTKDLNLDPGLEIRFIIKADPKETIGKILKPERRWFVLKMKANKVLQN